MKNGIIHFYDFESEGDEKLGKAKVKKACLLSNKKCRILRTVKTGHVGPREYRLCFDVKVL